MLAKQWLQSYERTGHTGSHKRQALLRTEKWVGAQVWGLRAVVEVLPTILLLSLGLFFVALCDYLWSTNTKVALVAVVFTIAGGAFYIVTVIAAAIDTRCPFQTPPSNVLRRAAIHSRDLYLNLRALVPTSLRKWVVRKLHGPH